MEDLISIVLPIYNGEKYMRESIDSVISQTYNNWELLILDDCSTDMTAEIAVDYANRDSRIHYYRNEQNLRLPRNLNKGFSLAKGDYLTWTSDDNRYLPQALEKMINTLKTENSDFVFASYRTIDGNGDGIDHVLANDDSIKRLIGLNTVGACFMYTRKAYEAVGDYDPELVLVEDFDYWQRIVSRFGCKIVSDILYEYRFHGGTLTSTMKRETFNKNLLLMLKKNRPSFGKVSLLQNYYYRLGIKKARAELSEKCLSDSLTFGILSAYYFVFQQIPTAVSRRMKGKKQ